MLPKKEQAAFQDIVDFYEKKQYKRAIKSADLVLKSFPNHGETLAMKGLVLNSMGKREEAHELARSGIKNDIRSHVTWHVYGLLHRSDRNYKEAIKCYLNALRMQPENQNILRDLSFLQVQLLDVHAFVETRRKLLVLKPTQKQYWIAFAVANFLAKDYATSDHVLKKFLETTTEEKVKYEHSELLLFHNRCLENIGDIEAALNHLESNKAEIVDSIQYRVKRAEFLTLQRRFVESLEAWLDLIRGQPDNYRFHAGAQTAVLQLDAAQAKEMFALKRLDLPCNVLILGDAQRAAVAALYGVGGGETSIAPSRSARKIALTLEPNEAAFRASLDSFMRKMLLDGVPSLCHDICALIKKPDDSNPTRTVFAKDPVDFRANAVCTTALDLVTEYVSNLKSRSSFDSAGEAVADVPTALLWSLYLKCHLLEMCGRHVEALAAVDECVAHTPTALDMHIKRGRILKKLGDVQGAAAVTDQCRKLDLQDRYLNNKATKYLLRANQIEQAMDTIALFTKHDGTDPQQTLFDLQCSWYELEAGECYSRLGQWGPALKKFTAIEKHFMDFIEDKFDFHSFCIRKVNRMLSLV
jgi:tetratricopeptide (TPR) repeat protein